jgi:hypothetical protein
MNFIKIAIEDGREANHFYFNGDLCLYKINRTRGEVIYLQCTEKNCAARAKISFAGIERTNAENHNHANHSAKAEAEIAYSQIREAVKVDRRSIREIHREAIRNISAEASGHIAWEHVRRTLQRIRQQHRQLPLCVNLDDLVALFEAEGVVYDTYGQLRDQPFYQGSADGMMVFANLDIVSALPADFEIFIDGTFGVTPFHTRSHQLFVILGEVNGRPRPLLYAVMTGRAQVDYIAILTLAEQVIWSFDGLERTPSVATCDFELAMRSALKAVHPDIRTVGCNFHFCQALHREAQRDAFLSTNVTGPTPQHETLLMFMRLSLLPIDRVDAGFRMLIDYINVTPPLLNHFRDFIVYFQNTWFNRYPKEEWCVSDRNRRTNNHMEGYNMAIKATINNNPSPYDFCDGLLDLAFDASAKYQADLLRHAAPPPDRSNITDVLRVALRELAANDINELQFLRLLAGAEDV